MNAALLGLLTALSFGTADFLARSSTRAFSAVVSLGAVMAVGSIALTVWIWLGGQPLVWSVPGILFAVLHGVATCAMCLLLYAGLARGPVSVVAPIVAAHPALVLLAAVVLGSRPSPVQWAAMAMILTGGVAIARLAGANADHSAVGREALRRTLGIALGACLAYALLILFGQAAARHVGELQTTWIGRLTGLAIIVVLLLARGERPRVGLAWMPILVAQGMLDTTGLLALSAGGNSDAPEVTPVVGSTFSVVTVLLSAIILREAVGARQWVAILMIVAGTAALAARL